MNTTIAINSDIRDKAAKKAQEDGLSVSAVVRILLLDYSAGNIEIGARTVGDVRVERIEVDEETRKKMDKVISAWDKKQ